MSAVKEAIKTRESRIVHTDQVLSCDLNNYQTLFGGVLMKKIDSAACLSARRHSRVKQCVTASTDSIDFLDSIRETDSVCVESFVTYTGRTSMEVFCKVIAEDIGTGARRIAATAFLTFVAIGEDKKPVEVPGVIPETEEEKFLFETAKDRAEMRKIRRTKSKELAEYMTLKKPWDR
ncbi:acyl-CoA thioesterase [Domibacillus sp.]|uniref:acyl-CoA thioesterase n=1 Tax=Domibacillus sp. TaxID=1969783 RepID=UPI0028120454|nr:acyl-CoA thioesterase [Domibacillus sp.]